MELGAVWGLRELADGHVFDDEDKWRVADAIEPGEGALIALVEHRWAIPVREAVRRAGGHAVAGRWIADQDLIRLGESSIADPARARQQLSTPRAVTFGLPARLNARQRQDGRMPVDAFQQELCSTSSAGLLAEPMQGRGRGCRCLQSAVLRRSCGG